VFQGPGVFAERVLSARAAFGANPFVAEMLDFIGSPGRHGILTSVARATGESEA
jgi:hypothetical protein